MFRRKPLRLRHSSRSQSADTRSAVRRKTLRTDEGKSSHVPGRGVMKNELDIILNSDINFARCYADTFKLFGFLLK